jgi:hypothetical protein
MKRFAFLRFSTATAAVALLVAGFSGCGSSSDNLPREAVSGGVTVDSKPLKSGIVTFVPTDPNGPTQGNFTVVEGKFSVPKEQGLVPGKYEVKVSTSEAEEKKESETFSNNAPGMPPIVPKDAIPAMYNSNTKLTAEVKAGVPNDFQFPLTTAAPK